MTRLGGTLEVEPSAMGFSDRFLRAWEGGISGNEKRCDPIPGQPSGGMPESERRLEREGHLADSVRDGARESRRRRISHTDDRFRYLSFHSFASAYVSGAAFLCLD